MYELEKKNAEIMREIARLRQNRASVQVREPKRKCYFFQIEDTPLRCFYMGLYYSFFLPEQDMERDPNVVTELAVLRQRKADLENRLQDLQVRRLEPVTELAI